MIKAAAARAHARQERPREGERMKKTDGSRGSRPNGYLELGVGSNTPVIIKFPFWTMTYDNPDAVYACLNYNEAYAPKQIAGQSICISGDTGEVLKELAETLKSS